MNKILSLYTLEGYVLSEVPRHEGGRNQVFICTKQNAAKYVLRISELDDRKLTDYLAETEFVHYLAQNGAPVADTVLSKAGNLVECISGENGMAFVSLFEYAKGEYISNHGYRYIEGLPLEKYHFDTGAALGKIHALAKKYQPVHRRYDYSEKYNKDYIYKLIPDKYADLRIRICELLDGFGDIEKNADNYGLVHFDYSDGNYHIDYSNGNITAFDFDNCCYCWYMYDLANLWLHGEGWLWGIDDNEQRKAAMKNYFDTIIAGYRSQTDLDDDSLALLPRFIDLELIENIVDELEVCKREGREVDSEDIEDKAEILTEHIPYAGFWR